MGHEVIRLPPYHCQYNPIELIWAQVKGEVATKNTTFKLADVEKLMHEAIDSVTYHGKLEKIYKTNRKTTNIDFFNRRFQRLYIGAHRFKFLTIDPNESNCSSSEDDDYF